MKPDSFVQQAERDAKIVQALHVARYTLVIHDGNMIRCEGEEWQLDFRREIALLGEAMELLGIDTSQPLIAPVQWKDEDED
ncbi:hypothetical protein [Paraburkholderia terricola]|uniref:hypothetical protein n=1 Tax=Paraburkholderia terricola TaxID=169427 RepID=UPI00285AF102|nr:hypothetical protein [Paraburkholderia terricola]MDR6485355.1 hypothetical protein [Paraburkholderia terricola]